MKTLTVVISDEKYNKFGIKNDSLKYSDFRKIIIDELFRQQISKCVKIAEKCGLSSMTMDEINDEVSAARREKCAML